MALRYRQLDGAVVEVPDAALQAFKASFRGAVLTADDPAYDETRQVSSAFAPSRQQVVEANAASRALRASGGR